MTRRLTVALALAVVALVAASGLAIAAFTYHVETPQEFRAVDDFNPPVESVLKAFSKTNDGGAPSSQIQLGLRLRNIGDAAIDLDEVTMRYWFTGDGGKSLASACYYAELGCGRLRLGIIQLDHAHDGADHYLDVSFTNGRLSPGENADLTQLAVLDQLGNLFDQNDDFSFLKQSSFDVNPQVTVYVNGQLVWGSEPDVLPDVESVEVRYANGDHDPHDAAIKPFLSIVNTGTVDVPLPDLTLRYWFTRDTESTDLIGFCDYAEISCDKVRTSFVQVTPRRPGADTYLEVTFASGLLDVGTATGQMQLRAHQATYGSFDETDDYSWATNTAFATTTTVTAYIGGRLVWGTEP